MKVFLATLCIVGFAAAVPCPILQQLNTQLQQSVEDIRANTEELIKSSGAQAKVAITAFVENPSTGSEALKNLITNDARSVFYKSTSVFNEMSKNIRIASSELSEVDPSLVKEAVFPILDNLRQELTNNLRSTRASILKHLEEAIRSVEEDTKAIESNPDEASKVQEKWSASWEKFVDEGRQYVAKVQQLVQDASDEIEKLYEQ